jgi:NADPH-dependent curcumin reductase CurA
MTTLRNREWLLVKRPSGLPQRSDYEWREGAVRAPGDGEVVVKVLYTAMDPAIRGWMDASGNYFTPIALGSPVMAVVLGPVVQSNDPRLPVGTMVSGLGSWSDYSTGPGYYFNPVVDADQHELLAFLHPLGPVGLTAHYGLFDRAGMKPGDAVLVSGATGGVGSLVAQMARMKGASKVVGIAGGAAKCEQAVELFGYDSCIDYRATPDLSAALAKEFPQGFNVFFENVGGKVLEAALDNMAKNARIVVCGMIAGYNATAKQPGPSNMWNLLVKTARIEGFLVADCLGTPAAVQMYTDISNWLKAGKLKWKVDVREGLEHIPETYNLLFSGQHDGKLIVKVANDA